MILKIAQSGNAVTVHAIQKRIYFVKLMQKRLKYYIMAGAAKYQSKNHQYNNIQLWLTVSRFSYL